MLHDLLWAIYLLENLGIAVCYFLIPSKLIALIQEPVSTGARVRNLTLVAQFVFWCGVHHLVMVPAMYLVMRLNYPVAFLGILAADLTTLVVSARALFLIRPD